MKVEKIESYRKLGKALRLSDGRIEAIVPLDIGLRVMHLSLIGRPSLFETDVPMEKELPNGETMRLFGGHRLWHSPEAFPRSYSADNDPLESYEIIDGGVRLVQKQEGWTQMKKSMELFFEDGHIRVLSSITNNNAWPVEFAVWALTIGSRAGREVVPVVQRNTGLQTNTGYRSWPYSRMDDHRVRWGRRYITVDNDPGDESAFKFGYENEAGWAAYFNHGQCFVKRFSYVRGAKYPDCGCSFQTYTTYWGLELESLSPLKLVRPGDALTHEELWYVCEAPEAPPPGDEDGIAGVMAHIAAETGIELPVVSGESWDPDFEEES